MTQSTALPSGLDLTLEAEEQEERAEPLCPSDFQVRLERRRDIDARFDRRSTGTPTWSVFHKSGANAKPPAVTSAAALHVGPRDHSEEEDSPEYWEERIQAKESTLHELHMQLEQRKDQSAEIRQEVLEAAGMRGQFQRQAAGSLQMEQVFKESIAVQSQYRVGVGLMGGEDTVHESMWTKV